VDNPRLKYAEFLREFEQGESYQGQYIDNPEDIPSFDDFAAYEQDES